MNDLVLYLYVSKRYNYLDIYIYMKSYKKADKKRLNADQCKDGYLCPLLKKNKCKYRHSTQLDLQKYQAYEKIKRKNKTIIIVNTFCQKNGPMCLFCDLLPIQIEENIQPGKYYEGKYIGLKQTTVLIKICEVLGQFGNLELEKQILQDYSPQMYKINIDDIKRAQYGRIDVNWNYQKVLKGVNFRKYLDKVNEYSKYPLFNDCEVRYIGNSRQQYFSICHIKYPDLRMSGILQIDPQGLFYFVSRNMKHDDCTPYRIPSQLISQVKILSNLVPYSFLKCYQIPQQLENNINKELKKYLIKGRFQSWPIQSRYPLIKLDQQFATLDYKNLKSAIIYEFNVDISPPTKKQKTQSQQICRKFNIKQKDNRHKWSQTVYTIDGIGTSCHDDAFSIKKVQQGYQVTIHIADAAQLIKQNSIIEKQISRRDETVYVKGYWKPLLTKQLTKILSLKSGQRKITYSMTFQISNQGLINFESVKFEATQLQISKNYRHKQDLRNDQNLTHFFQCGHLIAQGQLVSSGYFIDQNYESERYLNRFIHLSSLIPTFLIQMNQTKILNLKSQIDKYINRIIQRIKEYIKNWDSKRKIIKDDQKKVKSLKKQEQKITTLINTQLRKLKKQMKKNMKQQQAKQQKEQKGSKSTKSKQMKEQSEEFSDQITNISIQEKTQELEQEQRQNQIKQKQRMQKVDKIMNEKLTKLDESSESENQSQYTIIDQQQQKEMLELKKSAAKGGYKYVKKVFDHFKINMEWHHPRQIQEAFKTLKKQKPSVLFKKYIKRMQVMNRQHFKYWLQKQNFKHKVIKNEQEKSETYKMLQKQRVVRDDKNNKRQKQQREKTVNQKQEKIEKNGKQQKKKNYKLKYTAKNQIEKKQQDITKLKVQESIKQPKRQQNSQQTKVQKVIHRNQKQANLQQQNKIKIQLQKLQTLKKQNLYKDISIQKIDLNSDQTDAILQHIRNNAKIYFNKQIRGRAIFYESLFFHKFMTNLITPEQQQFLGSYPKQKQQFYYINKLMCIHGAWRGEQKKQKQQLKQRAQKNSRNIRKQIDKLVQKSKDTYNPCILQVDRFLLYNQVIQYCVQYFSDEMQQKIEEQKEIKWTDYFKKQQIEQKNPLQIYNYLTYKLMKIRETLLEKHITNRNKIQKSLKTYYQKKCGYYEKQLGDKVFDKIELFKQIMFIINKEGQSLIDFDIIKQEQLRQMKIEQEQDVQQFTILLLQRISGESVQRNSIRNREQKSKLLKKQKQKKSSECKSQKLQNKIVQNANKQQNIPSQQIQKTCQKTQQQVKQPKLQTQLLSQHKQNNENKPIIQGQLISQINTENNIQQKGSVNKIQINKVKKQKNSAMDLKLKQLKAQLQIKYNIIQLKKQIDQKSIKIKQAIKQNQQSIRQELCQIEYQYNFLDWVVAMQKTNKTNKKNKSKKSKNNTDNNTNNNKQQIHIISDILDIIDQYCTMLKMKFKLIKDEQIQKFIIDKIKAEQSIIQKKDIQAYNEQFIKKFRDWSEDDQQLQLLKWNNPIRSYAALKTLRTIKKYQWIFNGKQNILQVIKNHKQLKQLKNDIKSIKQFKTAKKTLGQERKSFKEANREIQKLDFYYAIKNKKQTQVCQFLNIGSPDQSKIKYVYHDVMGEIEVDNLSFKQSKYDQVKGQIKIINEFPLDIRVYLIE